MNPSLRSLLVFTGKFLALFSVLALLWSVLSLFYAGILVGIGNGTLTFLGYPPMLSLQDREIVLTVISQNVQVTTVITNFYGVPLLLALVWAAPALSPRARRRWSLGGVGSLALLQWLNLLCQAGMLLAPDGFWKFSSEQLFLLSALADMLLPTLLFLSLALRSRLIIPHRLQEIHS